MQSPQPHLQTSLPVQRTTAFGEVIIESFRNEYDFLSNFFVAPVTWRGINFPTSEHAYQWAKTDDPREQKTILIYVLDSGYEMPTTPGQAKTAGKTVTKRDDWEQTRLDVMYDILKAKFTQNADLRQRLLDTGDAELVEGNSWCDNTWGACRCANCAKKEKTNFLGKLLMRLRTELAKPSKVYCLGCPCSETLTD